jgi:hypothetical protein
MEIAIYYNIFSFIMNQKNFLEIEIIIKWFLFKNKDYNKFFSTLYNL